MGGYCGFDPKCYSDLGLTKCLSEVQHVLDDMEQRARTGSVAKELQTKECLAFTL